jgi:murein DD-endopeptidase MepM/ murein hydrolase activator NlpD
MRSRHEAAHRTRADRTTTDGADGRHQRRRRGCGSRWIVSTPEVWYGTPWLGDGVDHVSAQPVTVEFPLRGEWHAWRSPKEEKTSHQTARLAQRYAGTTEFFCWRRVVYTPMDGVVVAAEDGLDERHRVWILMDSTLLRQRSRWRDGDDSWFEERTLRPWRRRDYDLSNPIAARRGLHRILGNYVVVRHAVKLYSLFCHLHNGSVVVSEGQQVTTGALLGEVGSSGYSSFPHLHFQMMDASNPWIANGVECSFRCYEERSDCEWRLVKDAVPGRGRKIRSCERSRSDSRCVSLQFRET